MESYLPLIVQLIAGVIGGNAAGSAMKDRSLGTAGNSIAGAIGGGIVGQILQALMAGGTMDAAAATSGIELGSLITDIVGGGAGGAILTAVLGLLMNRFAGSR